MSISFILRDLIGRDPFLSDTSKKSSQKIVVEILIPIPISTALNEKPEPPNSYRVEIVQRHKELVLLCT